MRKQKEWIVILNNKRIDNNGYYSGHSCVTAWTKKGALRLLAKAKIYYFGTYRLRDEVKRNTRILCN